MARRARLYPVILAGGSGTRFWPLSRRARPKQLLALSGKAPLIVETVRRLRGLAGPQDVTVVCGALHAKEIRRLMPTLPKAGLLVEPLPRNTAPAIGWAAQRLLRRDPDATLAVLPSDHHIADTGRFRTLLRAAGDLARDGTLVTLGITPTGPETGFGYLRMGEALSQVAGARRVAAFVEKPSRTVAEGYLASGEYLWNAGIFVFRADAILAEIRRQLPELAVQLAKIDAAGSGARAVAAVGRHFPRCPSVSIDYGVMENAERVAVLPASFGWSDLGSFDALADVRRPDARGNVLEGEALALDCDGCLVLARPDRPIAVIGAQNMVVVDAGDAILVVPRSRVQDVRQAVAELERRRLSRVL